jgi:hypothetical protein
LAAANDAVTLRITDITGAAVDLTNGRAILPVDPTNGDGPYNSGVVVDDATTEAGQPVTFPIAVTNDGSVARHLQPDRKLCHQAGRSPSTKPTTPLVPVALPW